MSENFDGPKIERARNLLFERFPKDEMEMAITDISLTNPQFPQEGSYETWLQKTFIYLNSKRQLGKLFVELAKRMGAPEDSDACELLKLVEAANVPTIVQPLPPEPDDGKKVVVASGPAQPPPPIVIKHTKRTRVVLLGEAVAYSAGKVGESRKKAFAQLTDALQPKGIAVVDWGDSWNARGAQVAQPADAEALFVRVVNEDILNEDIEQLFPLPQKLAQKLKLPKSIDASQVVIWNCEAGQGAATADPGSGQEQSSRDEIKKRLEQEGFFLAEKPIEGFIQVLRGRLGLEKWPPALRLEHPGDNKLIQKKLIDVILQSTKGKCQPPYPEMVYFEITSPTASEVPAIELKDLLSDDAARNGVIIAIHDLNLTMTDDPKEALWAFQDRIAAYDNLLSEIVKSKKIPRKKIVKLAVLMASANWLEGGQYPYSYMNEDWAIVSMKRDKELAVLEQGDERVIRNKVDALLGSD